VPTYRVGANLYAVVAVWGQHTGGAVNTAGTSQGAQVPWLPPRAVATLEPEIFLPALVEAVNIDLTPALLSFVAVESDPDPGVVSVSLSPSILTLQTVATSPSPGVVTVTLTPALLGITTLELDPEPLPSIAAAEPSVLSLGAQPLDPDPGVVTLSLTPTVLSLVTTDSDPDPGPVATEVSPAALTFVALDLDPDPGLVATEMSPAALTLVSLDLDPDPGSVTTEVSPAALTLAPPGLDPDPGVVTNELAPAALPLVPSDLDPDPGAVTNELVPVDLQFAPQALGIDSGQTSAELSPVGLSLEALSLDAEPGLVAAELTVADLGLSTMELEAAPGNVAVELSPSQIVFHAAVTYSGVPLVPTILELLSLELDPAPDLPPVEPPPVDPPPIEEPPPGESPGPADEVIAAMEEADFFVGPLMTQLLACLCEEAALAENPPAICCFRVGTEVVHDAGLNEDQCCRGIAYVSLGDTYPASQSFPEQDIVRQASSKCGPPTWAQIFKIGIIRCAPIGDGLNAIHCDEWNAAAIQNVIDSRTLRRVSCCFRDFVVDNQERFLGMSLVIERQSQGNPLGGCIERSLTMVAQIPNDCEC
jgi:hypothetical protein